MASSPPDPLSMEEAIPTASDGCVAADADPVNTNWHLVLLKPNWHLVS